MEATMMSGEGSSDGASLLTPPIVPVPTSTPPVIRADSSQALRDTAIITKERSSSTTDVKVSFEIESDGGGSGSDSNSKLVSHRRTPSGDKLAKLIKPPFKKSTSDAPISKELSDRARSAPLVKKFALPPTETLVNDYSAALLKHILIHGRMYVSQNYICFESKIFGIKTMEVIPFKDITILTKKSKKLKFAHGIEVATSSQTYYFASFVSREKAMATLIRIWRQHVPKEDNHLDDFDEDDEDDSTQDYESDDSSLKKKDKKVAKEHADLKLGRSVEEKVDHSDDKEKGLRRFSSPILSRVLPANKQHNSSSNLVISTTNLETAPQQDQDSVPPSPASNRAPTPSNVQTSSSTVSSETPVPSPHESEDEEYGMYDEGDGFLGSEAPFQSVLTTTFPIGVKTFFKLFFSDESTFSKTYHDSRSDKDLVVKPWTNSSQFGLIRDVLFLSPVKVPLGPSHTRITETQRYHLTKTRLLIDTISMMLDIPYGDSFRVEGKWDVSAVTPDSCKLVVNIGVHFMKKTWFKGKIETQTIKETKESFQQWAALAPSEIAKYKASLPSISQPPSAATSPVMAPRSQDTSSLPPTSAPQQTSSIPTSTPITSSVSIEPTPSLEGASSSSFRRSSRDDGKQSLFSKVSSPLTSLFPTSPFQGLPITTILLFIIIGFIFFNMYTRIVYLEGKVATLESILQPIIAKAAEVKQT